MYYTERSGFRVTRILEMTSENIYHHQIATVFVNTKFRSPRIYHINRIFSGMETQRKLSCKTKRLTRVLLYCYYLRNYLLRGVEHDVILFHHYFYFCCLREIRHIFDNLYCLVCLEMVILISEKLLILFYKFYWYYNLTFRVWRRYE